MDLSQIRTGLKVRVAKLKSTTGLSIDQELINNRKMGVTGVLQKWVPGHGGDMWYVKHDNGKMAVYAFDELEKLE